MQLTLPPRDMLIARMQVYVYENVKYKNCAKASEVCDSALKCFDDYCAYSYPMGTPEYSGMMAYRFFREQLVAQKLV